MNTLNLGATSASYLNTQLEAGVLTVTMNRPEKLNGWTMEMMLAIQAAFAAANERDDVKAVIFTGTGKYYSAGVNLGGTLKIMAPKKLKALITKNNQALFDTFLNCSKPLLIAVNGPAIGASVTSATLANYVIASESATFSTPFAALGITPEGCSSIHFPRLIGEENARRMLGQEGWKPDAKEALQAGLVQAVAPADSLMDEAQRIARSWVEKEETRTFLAGSELANLRETNAAESEQLASAFLGAKFLQAQTRFLWKKQKYVPALMFVSLLVSRPLWAKLL
ncbi:enoyl-CoA hydratase/isomerase family protein [Photobacterium sanctipauli]|uniref:Enoyl-CoA hydratase/isomerase family protein n=1 Tax=Photobacterium sanctipauli TaxID=1342794 RepID=A0A2T3NYB8_9GAMM|nr:enoyl-CoA hydratase/isomerase family protein [Photobacterium sanctipauli]PSW21251.1 enoyl-CoA hydratase/isomerase family protein [Photobacterium sanctipauli]